MISMTSLWLVILVGAVFAHIGSMIVWMALPHHKSDFSELPDEDGAADSLRAQNLSPGQYNIPHCSDFAEYKTEAMQAKMNNGPIVYMTVMPNGMPNMGKMVLQQILYFLVIGALIAYVVSQAMPAGADYMSVFRMTAATAWLAYGWSIIPDAIWFGRPWKTIVKYLFDALLYALLTAGAYAWLWPAAG